MIDETQWSVKRPKFTLQLRTQSLMNTVRYQVRKSTDTGVFISRAIFYVILDQGIAISEGKNVSGGVIGIARNLGYPSVSRRCCLFSRKTINHIAPRSFYVALIYITFLRLFTFTSYRKVSITAHLLAEMYLLLPDIRMLLTALRVKFPNWRANRNRPRLLHAIHTP